MTTENSLFNAIKDGKDDVVEQLINSSIDINQKKDKKTPLLYALDFPRSKIIFTLINHGADVNAIDTDYGCHHSRSESCFQTAIARLPRLECDPKELLTLLLTHGADPNEQSDNSSGGMRSDYTTQFQPIHTLTRHNTLDIGCLRLLLQYKANVNSLYKHKGGSEYGFSENTSEAPLHIAVHNKNLAMVQLLIEWQADINMKGHYIDNREIQKKSTVRDPRAPGYISNINNVLVERTPLHIAIQENSNEIVRYLVLSGANPYIDYKEKSWGNPDKILTTWELCRNDEELTQLLNDIRFTPKDYKILHPTLKITIKILLLCDLRNNWKLPKDILFKIFSYLIQAGR